MGIVAEAMFSLLSPMGLAALIGGVSIGFVIGVLPGLGAGTAMILCFPIVFLVPKEPAFIAFAAMLGSSVFGGSITSIILNTPGSVSNLTTMLDGYPMAKNGHAGRALGLAATSSMFGASFGLLILMVLIPFVKEILHIYGAREFFWTVVFSLMIVGLSSAGGAFFKGLAAGLLGILASYVGFSGFLGNARFTGGSDYLWDGIDMGAFMIGLFALSELVVLQARGSRIISSTNVEKASYKQTFKGAVEALRMSYKMIPSSIIGTIVGIIPGIGASVACFLSYALAKFFSKDKALFGNGSPEGILASEATNNAKDGGALLPTLFFGVPGSPEMAIILGAFTVVGIIPGPEMAERHLALVWIIILACFFGNMIACGIMFSAAPLLSRITTMSITTVLAFTVPISLTGIFVARTNIWDVVFSGGFCILGLMLKRTGFPIAPLIIGYILGPMLEKSFHLTLKSSFFKYTGFLHSPMAFGMAVFSCILILAPIFLALKHYFRDRHRLDGSGEHAAVLVGKSMETVVFTGLLIIIDLFFLIQSYEYGSEGGILPRFIAFLALPLLLIVFFGDASQRFGNWMQNALGPFGKKGRLQRDASMEKLVPVMIWLLLFIASIFFFGYYITILVAIWVLLKKWGGLSSLKAALYALSVEAMIVMVYVMIFGTRLWSGFIPTIVPNIIGGGTLPPF